MKVIVLTLCLVFSFLIFAEEPKQAKMKYEDIIAESMIKDLLNRLVAPEKRMVNPQETQMAPQSKELLPDTSLEFPKKKDPTYIPILWDVFNNNDRYKFTLLLKKEIDVEVINGDIMITFGNGFVSSQDEINLCLSIKL